MGLKVAYMSDEAIEKDAQAMLADYARARGTPIEAPIPIDDIIEKHLKIGIEFDDTHRLFGVPRSGIEAASAAWHPLGWKLKEAAKSVGNAADKLEEVADVIEYLNRETAREALAKCVEALRSARCGVIDVPTEEDMRDYVREIDEAIKQAKQALGEGESKFDDPQFATSLEELEELIWSRAEILRLNVSLNRLRDQIADPETVTITRKRYEQYQRAEAELTLERKKLEDLLKGESK